MNYDKKRKRQNGRQDGSMSNNQKSYMEGYMDGQHNIIDKMIENGILPEVNFDLKPRYYHESTSHDTIDKPE
jgi:hypothetical protein